MRVSRESHQRHGQAHTGQGLRDLLPWTPTLLGVVALFVLLIVAATRFTPSPAPAAIPPAPTFLPPPVLSPADLASAPAPLPSLPYEPPPSAGPPAPVPTSTVAQPDEGVVPAGVTKKPRPSRTPSRAATTTPAPAPTAGPVRGRYQVLNSYGGSFIGEVLVSNTSARDSGWQVQLRFPAAVGELITAWVEGAPQATLRRSGDSYIWSSGAPVAAGAQVPLRFHFNRSGTGNLPSSCTVNGGSCTGVR